MSHHRIQFSLSIAHSRASDVTLIRSFVSAITLQTEHEWVVVSDLSGDVVLHEKGLSVWPLNPGAILLGVSREATDGHTMLTLPLSTYQVVSHLNRCGAQLESKLGGSLMDSITQVLAKTAHDLRVFTQTIEAAVSESFKHGSAALSLSTGGNTSATVGAVHKSALTALDQQINDVVIQPKLGKAAFGSSLAQPQQSQQPSQQHHSIEQNKSQGSSGNQGSTQQNDVQHRNVAHGTTQAVQATQATNTIAYQLTSQPPTRLLVLRDAYMRLAYELQGKTLTLEQMHHATGIEVKVCQEFIQALTMMGLCKQVHLQLPQSKPPLEASGLMQRVRSRLGV